MEKSMRTAALLGFVSFVVMGLSCRPSAAQEKSSAPASPNLAAYDLSREVTLVGVVQAYSSSGQLPPHGPHVILRTASGLVDVHLGNASLLAANHFTIQSGDTLRIIGENLASGSGTQFVARVVQKGTQALIVRTSRGIPLSYMAPRDPAAAKSQGGVL